MSYEFLGQHFTSCADFSREFPAYGQYFWKYVVAGAKTPTEIEVMARKCNAAGAAKSRKSARERMGGKTQRIV
jgi:hypothetical protein